MKKTLVITIISATSLFATPITAAPLDVYGDFRLRFQSRTGDTDSATKGDFTLMRTRVNLDGDLGEDWRFYSRLAIDEAAGKAHNNGLYDTSGAFDRWGVQRKFPGGSIKLGRQDIVLGQEGLALTTLIDAVGENNQLTGATVTVKVDSHTTLKAVGGRLGDGLFEAALTPAFSPGHPPTINANLYAVQVNHKVDQRLSVGGTYRTIATIDNTSSYWAKRLPPNKDVFHTSTLFGNYYLNPKTAIYTELGQSNADQYNFAAGVGIGHILDRKNSVSLNYFKQDKNSGMFANWGAPDFARNLKGNNNTSWTGLAAYLRHSLDKNTMLELSDYYEKGNNTNTANQSRITLSTSF